MSVQVPVEAGPSVVITTTDGQAFPCAPGDTLLRAALRAGLPAAYECNSGGCGTCKFTLDAGAAVDVQPDPPGLTPRDKRKGRRLACQAVPSADCAVTMTLATGVDTPRRPTRRIGTVTAARALTHDMRELTIRTDGPADFLPGQYAMLAPPWPEGASVHGPGTDRAYSMSNLPNADGLWEFQIKRMPGGAYSARLVDVLEVGSRIGIDGPYGHAYLQPVQRDVVCIAGGSGLAPMVSVARGLAARDDASDRRLAFFYGGRTEVDLCASEFVAEVTPRLREASFIEALSGEAGADWAGPRGLLHEVLATHAPADLADREIYLAGPPAMTDAVVRYLVLERGISADHLHFDRFF